MPNPEVNGCVCQNAIFDKDNSFRCRIIDLAHAHNPRLTIHQLEFVTKPHIYFAAFGVGEQTRCAYDQTLPQQRCAFSSVDNSGIEKLFTFAQAGECIIFPEKKDKLISVFGEQMAQRIWDALDQRLGIKASQCRVIYEKK